MATVRIPKHYPLLLFMLGTFGCSEQKPVHTLNPTEERLTKIGKAYNQACFRLGRPPRNVEEIKPDIDGGFSDDLLRSPNDEQEFVIIWGVDYNRLPPRPNDPFTVGAYEKVGVGGQRYVLRFPLGVQLMTDEAFGRAAFPPGHTPAR
jgi:hypothetical protein